MWLRCARTSFSRKRLAAGALAVALGLIALVPDASAQSTLEGVLMPGKVIEGHAKLEAKCSNCHVRFDRVAQDRLCLDCHKDVAADVSRKQGHHGRMKAQPCRSCHTEHRGREADIAPVAGFDHSISDFPLRGAHASPKLECKSCHKPGAKYRQAPSQCSSCHKKDDVHKGRLGTACADCHTDKRWKDVHFNHDKTGFPLAGKHAPLACKDCHRDNQFKNTPKTCVACHKKDDVHKGTLGTSCGNCHTERDWKQTRFDHSKTRFPLLGKHQKVECKACHKTAVYRSAPTDCVACHKKDDVHKGKLGPACGNCHNERDWKQTKFDHDKTRFPLLGKHRAAKCDACHKDQNFKQTPSGCYACHKKDDKHEGQLGQDCKLCHVAQDWKKTSFDHGRTRFPLVGRHLIVQCKSCHSTPRYKDAKSECVACHSRDDVHKKRLGPQCETCHNARDWKAWDFNHDRRTQFALDGAHRKLDCYACHRLATDRKPTLGTACVSCHAADDVHDGSFGRQCDKCHVTSSFKQVKPRLGGAMALPLAAGGRYER